MTSCTTLQTFEFPGCPKPRNQGRGKTSSQGRDVLPLPLTGQRVLLTFLTLVFLGKIRSSEHGSRMDTTERKTVRYSDLDGDRDKVSTPLLRVPSIRWTMTSVIGHLPSWLFTWVHNCCPDSGSVLRLTDSLTGPEVVGEFTVGVGVGGDEDGCMKLIYSPYHVLLENV